MGGAIIGAVVGAAITYWLMLPPSGTYTLYRTSTLGPARIHVATFDAKESDPNYNQGNCKMVVRYLLEVPGVPPGYYWCELGAYRPG